MRKGVPTGGKTVKRCCKVLITFIALLLLSFGLAACNKKEYTVTLIKNNGEENEILSLSYGDAIDVTEPTYIGYSFVGWYTDEALTEQFTAETMPSVDVTLYAKWEACVYSLIYETNGASAILSEEVTIEELKNKTLPTPEKEGYSFAGWYIDSTFETAFDLTYQPTESSIKLYAKYTPDEYSVTFHLSDTQVVNVSYGENISDFPDGTKLGYELVCWQDADGNTIDETSTITGNLDAYPIYKIAYSDFPAFIIDTNDVEIVSKEEYVKCSVSVENAATSFCFEDESGKIKGRGNSTWGRPKKPYKLKFESKVNLFGNGKAKTWTLIANYCDQSLSRNYLAYSVASLFNSLQSTTTTQFVDLYLNDVYCGVYLVCEQNETGSTRVDIEDDLEDKDPEQIDYLLELDGRIEEEGGTENVDYFIVEGYKYAIKSPDVEDEAFTSDYVTHIKNFIQTCYTTVTSDTSTYDEVEQYIDMESFAECFIVHEIFKTVDVGWTSFWMYTKDNKLYCGPVWDFDVSVGNYNYVSITVNTIWNTQNPWYNNLLNHEEFVQLLQDKLNTYKSAITNTIKNDVSQLLCLKTSFERNFEKWQILGVYVYPNPDELVALKTWEEHLLYVEEWLFDSIDYLSEWLGEQLNGGNNDS